MLSHVVLVSKLFRIFLRLSYNQLCVGITTRLHRLTYRQVSSPRTVVIIGASFAGFEAAYRLANSIPSGYQVVVIEKNSHFQFTWVFPRFCVVEGHEHKAFVPYRSYLASAPSGSWRWVRGRVSRIVVDEAVADRKAGVGNGGYVELNGSGERIPFEYLVLATGSTAEIPSRLGTEEKSDGIQLFHDMQGRLRSAGNVVIVGGGPVGVELAADTKALYPDKTVNLVHSRTTLLNNRFGLKLHKVATRELEKLGVNVVLGVRLSDAEAEDNGLDHLLLSSGEKLPCDCLIKCIGQRPSSDLIKSLSPGSITTSGHVRVRPTLQLASTRYENVFAIGDVIDRNEARNGLAAILQARIVAENVVRAIKRQKLLEYKPAWWESTINLTLGLHKNVAYMSDGSADFTISSSKKGIALDSKKAWQYFGVKPFVDPLELDNGK